MAVAAKWQNERCMSAAANIEDLEAHRVALTGHCYRMLGSPADADDAVQEAMIRAWRGLDRFDGRASVRTWLYRIATNVCLDALSSRARRVGPTEDGPQGTPESELVKKPRTHWLEPIADQVAIPQDEQPAEQAMLRQSIRLAFVAALQRLPPRQRAALLMVEVLGWSAAETAEALDMTVPAVNSALQRARATVGELREAEPGGLTAEQRRLAERYAEAFERYDLDALVALMREDATLSMPPYALWLRGEEQIRAWMLGRGIGCEGSRLVPVDACGAPAFGQYRDGGRTPWSLIVLDVQDDAVAGVVHFLEVEDLFPRFGLPMSLPA
ncbi:MAG: sigma-70 family RNA polymerase sigma factor [Bryobacterales bacterium]